MHSQKSQLLALVRLMEQRRTLLNEWALEVDDEIGLIYAAIDELNDQAAAQRSLDHRSVAGPDTHAGEA